MKNNLTIPFRLQGKLNDYFSTDGEISTAEGCILQSNAEGADCNGDDAGDEDEKTNETASGLIRSYSSHFPPSLVPAVDFRLKRSVLPGWHIHPDILPGREKEVTDTTPSEWGKRALETLIEFKSESARQNLFFASFLAISAWRLKSGRIILPSPPVLLIPNSETPLITATQPLTANTMEMKAAAAVCRLQYRVRIPEELRDFTSEIEGLELMVSRELTLFDRNGKPVNRRRCTSFNFSGSYDSESGEMKEKRVSADTFENAWHIPEPENYSALRELIDIQEFHSISHIPIEKLRSLSDFTDVEFNLGRLSDLRNMTGEVPQYSQLSLTEAEGSLIFSGRNNIWNIRLTPPPFKDISGEELPARWVFHPDPEAREFRYKDKEGSELSLKLRPHPRLYGSIYFGGLEVETDGGKAVTDGSLYPKPRDKPSAIMRSEKDDPNVFTDRLLLNPDVNRVIALCRAYRASGLVATTSPTAYAFTDAGVFLFRESEDGVFKDAGLICGYVLKDAESLKILPTGIEFITTENEKVTVSGTSVKTDGTSSAGATKDEGCVTVSGTGKEFRIITRPMKLNDTEDLKSVAEVAARGKFNPERIGVRIYGSLDLNDWELMAERKSGGSAGAGGMFARFFRIEIEGFLKENEEIYGLALRLQ